MLKKIICAALALVLALSGCSAPKTLGFDIPRGVDSFDPQLAESDPELIIVENCFQGLLDKDENGIIIPGAAESWKVSEDGLTYTFNIKEGLFWNDGETPVTADDFLFAFQRLFSAETSAPPEAIFSISKIPKLFLTEKAEEIPSALKQPMPIPSLSLSTAPIRFSPTF